jgi:acetyltransferase-like isoleucine patch superfamily enzyme
MMVFLQKIAAKFINSKLGFNNPYLNFGIVKMKMDELKINRCLGQVTIGEKSKFHEQAEVFNLQGDKGKILIGANTHIRGALLLFAHNGNINIGNNCYIGFGTQIWSANNIKIGNDVLISHNCNIIDTNSHEENYLERKESYIKMLSKGHPTENVNVKSAPIIIEDHVWISFNVSILKGVTIGKGAIIAGGAVITKDVAPFTMVAGNPAVFIKNIS